MQTLHDFQAMFRGAMFAPAASPLLTTVVADGLPPAARLQIYRHHVLTSLTEALKAIFPVLCRLVDARFFAYAADIYIRQHPPESPCLFEYGASFPDFLAVFPPCRELPYLADVARLEWALNVAYHAEARAPIAVEELRDVPAERMGELVLQCDPARIVLASTWPIDAIWLANQESAEAVGTPVDLASGGVYLETLRWTEDVGFRQLEAPLYTLRAALAAGEPLEAAVEAALAVDAAFDCTAALCEMFSDGIVVGWQLGTALEG